MININFYTDADKVMQKFEDFSYKEMKKTTKSAMRKAAGIIARAVKKNLKTQLPAANVNNSNGKYADRLIDGVIYKGYSNSAKIHVLGNKKANSGTFRLRFFENGTVVRRKKTTTSKERNFGRIEALHFFSEGLSSSKDKAYSAIDEQLIKMIEKINKKKINGK